MESISIALTFHDPGYIGKPFWPETNTLINIQKDVHPKLGDAKKKAALLAACEKRGISEEQYEQLVEKSKQPFYMQGSEIVIPERILQSFINHASMAAPRAIPRVESKGLTFIGIKVQKGHLVTGRTLEDAKVFGRFVKNQESNQRMWSEDKYITEFTATGVLQIDKEIITSENLKKLMEYGGRFYGIGTARPQGYGRFQVVRWEKISES
jgi:hypothetical protein